MIDIQYDTTIMGGREVSRPYQVWFFAESERFLSFWRCHRPRKRATLKGCFFMFLFQSPSIFPLSPSPSPQHNTTTLQKDLRKQIHKHEQPPTIYTENQQVEFFLTKFTTLWTTTL